MKEAVLVVIKPDGISRALVGNILTRLSQARLELVGVRMLRASRKLAEDHYRHIEGRPFYNEVIDYLLGKFHNQKNVIALIYRGENAIKKCRKISGATNPEEAEPTSVRGAYGRITTKGIFENLLHVSSDRKEAEREIKLWFNPDDIPIKLFPTKIVTTKLCKKIVWA